MRFKQLNDWLPWLETLHPRTIDLSLTRVLDVAEPHGLNQFSIPVITIAGTNGKGSTVASLEAIYCAAGYRVGAYTSPHLLHFNERICVNGQPVSDDSICQAFEQVDQWRDEKSLTYFEFITLAALHIFQQSALDVVLLEVGLGGRLDAVNTVDSDIAVITSIAIDHCAWLGNDREAIGGEKAGILRKNAPLVFGQTDMPRTIATRAQQLDCPVYQFGSAFDAKLHADQCVISLADDSHITVNKPRLVPSNIAIAAQVTRLLQPRLPVDDEPMVSAIDRLSVPGRTQEIQVDPQWLVDVAHNPHSVQNLAETLRELPKPGRCYALFSMLADKDIVQCLTLMKPLVDEWLIAPLHESRALSSAQLNDGFKQAEISHYQCLGSIGEAYQQLQATAQADDRIIVFGSFYTVAKVLALRV